MANGVGNTSAAVRSSRSRSPARGGGSGPVAAPSRSQAEHVIARMRPSARRLTLPVLGLLVIAGAAGYFAGNLSTEWENVALPFAAATAVVFVTVFPFLFWLSRTYVITTRRIVIKRGFFFRSRQEMLLTRGYDVTVRRGPLQSLFRSGDIVINTGLDEPLILRDVPNAHLVQAALADLMEYSTNVIGSKRQQDIAATRRPFDP